MLRRAFLTLALQRPSAKARAVQALLDSQSSDGAWRSTTYGLLRSGQSLTGQVLLSLLESNIPIPKDRIAKASEFLRANTSQQGAVGTANPLTIDYPVYATSLAARALIKAGQPGWRPMLDYLRSIQLTEQNGWQPADPAYGAWGIGGSIRRPPFAGHIDLSMTRHALEAFHAARQTPPRAARKFIKRLQNKDGGFCFSTTVADANKAGKGIAYGTATSDGYQCQRLLGLQTKPAEIWLRTHHRPNKTPGFDNATDKRWTQGLFFYYASVYPFQDPSLTTHLLEIQTKQGTWKNPETLVKEDDPLIATSLALMALNR